jgi:glucuronate isomerase
MKNPLWQLDPDRYFDPDPTQRSMARELYTEIAGLPIVSPHGHVDPKLFASNEVVFGSPVDLLIIPDHYIFRMLYSQGIPLESLGIKRVDGSPVETDHRKIWAAFAENYYLFHGTPSGVWLAHVLQEVLGIDLKLTSETADVIYDQIVDKLNSSNFQPRALYDRFNIEVLCTTDAAEDPLDAHQAIRESGWGGKVLPTFRPDNVINLMTPGWVENIQALSEASGVDIDSFPRFIQAVEGRRAFFKSLGAKASDHAALSAFTTELPEQEAEIIFQRAINGKITPVTAHRFTAHMLMESARMSLEDGLVMQIHIGSLRNHNDNLYDRFGPDMGADIPRRTELTENLRPLLNKFGNDPRLTLVVFTLDEATYSREMAPMAGHYPALKLGPPWWFHDSINGIQRYFDRVMETAGLHNTVGFNDDTRAFPSIPARHDVWRRASANWTAGLVARGIVDMDDASEMCLDLAYRLAKKAYKFE